MNDRVSETRGSEMYPPSIGAATRLRIPTRTRFIRALDGAILGIGIWLLLLTLGFAWTFHLSGLDGMLPCALAGGLLCWYGMRRVIIAVGAALSVALFVIAYTPIVQRPVYGLIRNDPLPAHADAVMVLSAGVNNDGTISSSSVDRLIKGVELVTNGIAPVLVVSREAYILDGKTISSRQEQEKIIGLSRPGLSHMIVAGVTHSTHDEAMRARELFRANNWKRIVVVTSPAHTKRACRTFEKAGVVVSCVASAARDLALNNLVDPFDRVKAFQLLLYETAGTIRYRQLGWL
jgi:uncharacterized SAM-binding protein YcdF (DUF218 family)